MIHSQCVNLEWRMIASGQELPRQSQAGAAALLPKTDTKAKYQRGREGLFSDLRAAAKNRLYKLP